MSLGIIQGGIVVALLILLVLLFKPKNKDVNVTSNDDWGVDDIQKIEIGDEKSPNRYTLTGNYFDDRQELVERGAWIGDDDYLKVRDSILNEGKVIYID